MKALLQSVSRSFYLTIRFLPRTLREPVGLAYLLARATDTIADTAEIPPAFRLTTLQNLARVIAGTEPFASMIDPLREFASRQANAAERTLIENLHRCLDQLDTMPPADREDIRVVLATIVRGQELDVRRFGEAAAPVSLQSPEELDEYTYLVAGCVGDFWTKLGFRHCSPFADRSPNEMSELGIEYGKGLQLINVLRDSGADLRAGRGYLPAGESFFTWLDRAEEQIGSGLTYASALTNWRIRFATVLPALIGARTIALLREASTEARRQKIKVPRKAVRRILLAGALASVSPIALNALFQRLAQRRE